MASGSKTFVVHGKSVSGNVEKHNPTIKGSFSYSTSRSGETVYIALTNIKMWTSAYYDYSIGFWASVGGNDPKTKLCGKSPNGDKNGWTVTGSNRTLSQTPNRTTSVTIKIWGYASDEKNCYNGAKRKIAEYSLPVPAYDTLYSVEYDCNGGINGPATQQYSVQNGITISDIIPVYPVPINYHTYNSEDPSQPVVVTEGKTFDTSASWDTGTYYPTYTSETILIPNTAYYGGSTISGDIIVKAIWGGTTFTSINPENEPITVTFDPVGGTVNPTQRVLYTTVNYYSLTPDGTKFCDAGATATLPANLDSADLYPIYNNVTLRFADIPIPTKTDYVFEGWYLDSNYTTKVTGDLTINKNTTLYARYYKSCIWRRNANSEWERLFGDDIERAPYVWQCVTENGVKVWKKVAQIYRCTNVGGVKRWEKW